MKKTWILALAGLAIVLVAAAGCATITPTPTPIPTNTPTSTPVPTPTPTPLPVKEWNLEDIKVDGSTVTVVLRVFAGIDVDVTLDGMTTGDVRPTLPTIEYVFWNVAPGTHTVEVRDVVGYTETEEVTTTAPTDGLTQVAVGREFTLRAGETVEIATAYFILSFDRVVQDSRCAQDVVCIWAGNATLEFTAAASGSPGSLTFTMTTLPDGTTSTRFHGYDILVSDLQPYPVSTSPIEPGDYSVTVLVEVSAGLPTVTPNAQATGGQ